MPTPTRDVTEEGASLYVTLGAYLERMEALERSKPVASRRQVPTTEEIAAQVGVSRQTIYNHTKGEVRQLNLAIAGRIIAALRTRGFPMEITDLLAYRE